MLEIQKAISEVNSLDFGRLDTAGQEINELEDKSIKIVHTEPHCQKKSVGNRTNLYKLWDKQSNIPVIKVPRREKKKRM